MSIHYYCRHCKSRVGALEGREHTAADLGLSSLNAQEMNEAVHEGSDGRLHIQTICSHCYEAQRQNPALHELDYWVH
ncbi:uncharacterized protein DUF2757 [Salsuginibacillus halophilus]|uniref:Uncharacterized protein DUF2757 n=1 Tax=Salsuginibacillus halophilus TaxID=517424 RepID=A0A2P8H7P7_9BACI|nr:anti-sigma-F factor Fin [Salsuginibacillus halophilus]PSL42257.1 uncharacterized protein DUF2757 [Salsuginibacillus halophilus]